MCRRPNAAGWRRRGAPHFFGLPAGSTQLEQSQRPGCTISELAYIGAAIADGWYLLSLQAPAIAGDAVPSRPVLYPLRAA